MPQELPPAVRRFQQIKAARKAAKIKEVQAIAAIKEVNPDLTDTQAFQVYEANEALKARTRNIQVQNRHRRNRSYQVQVITK